MRSSHTLIGAGWGPLPVTPNHNYPSAKVLSTSLLPSLPDGSPSAFLFQRYFLLKDSENLISRKHLFFVFLLLFASAGPAFPDVCKEQIVLLLSLPPPHGKASCC
jgi:hypothetical protein